MKLLKYKFMAFSGSCALAAIFMLGPSRDKVKNPQSGTSLSIRNFLNVHESPVKWLEVGGKRYFNVLGEKPYYLAFSGGDAYFFVTSDRYLEHRVAHFIFVKDGKSYDIPAGGYSLGNGIGLPGGKFYVDEIDSYHWPIVVVKSQNLDFYEFNLIKGTCEEIKNQTKR